MLRPQMDTRQPLAEERRLDLRVKLQFPIEVSGFELDGKTFTDLAKTYDVSRCGCCFPSPRKLTEGECLLVRTITRDESEINHSMLCEVVWIRADESGY